MESRRSGRLANSHGEQRNDGGYVRLRRVGLRWTSPAATLQSRVAASSLSRRPSHPFRSPLTRRTRWSPLARKPNYDFEKYRKERDRKEEKAEKLRRKREKSANQRGQSDATEPVDSQPSHDSPDQALPAK